MTQPLKLFAFFVVLLDLGLAGHGRTEERPAGRREGTLTVATWLDERLCDLNTAPEAELVALPGIGPTRAKAIIAYRESHPFRSVTDLMRIKGIGRKTFGKLRPLITVSLAGTAKDGTSGQKQAASFSQGGKSNASKLK